MPMNEDETPDDETAPKATTPPKRAGGVLAAGKNIRHLRSLGQALDPVVSIGKHGLTDALVDAAKGALLRHELIKIKVQGEAPLDRKQAAEALAEATGALLAQVLGRTFLLFRRHPSKPKIELPLDKKKPVTEAPRAPKRAARGRRPATKRDSRSRTRVER